MSNDGAHYTATEQRQMRESVPSQKLSKANTSQYVGSQIAALETETMLLLSNLELSMRSRIRSK